MVADALSCNPTTVNALMTSLPPELQEEMAQLNLIIVVTNCTNMMVVTPTLEEEIRKTQSEDTFLQHQVTRIKDGKTLDFLMDGQGSLRFRGRICVPKVEELREKILKEAHECSYLIHPGGTKMYEDLRQTFWWDGMKKDIAYFVAYCDICNKVKAEHQKPARLLQP